MRTPKLLLVAVVAVLIGGLSLLVAACGSGSPGTNGTPGANALVSTSPEPAGANCPYGGTKIEVGLDTNGNGVLDPSEVDQAETTYVCNGAGTSSLIKTSPEPAGTNCQFGGERIDTGADTNNNGVLDPNEITNTTYVCNTAPSGSLSVSNGIVIAVKPGDVSTSTTGPITVRFTLKDSNGFPVDLKGVYSINQPITPTFALAYYTKDANGNVSPLTVFTQSAKAAADGGAPLWQPTMYSPQTSTGAGTIAENGIGAGDYTYTFPATTTQPTSSASGYEAVAYDTTKTSENHVVWIAASRETDMVDPTNGKQFYTANYPYYFIPAGGTATPRQIIANSNCQSCHDNFRLESTTSDAFIPHGGQRIDGEMCNVCHNPGRVSNPAADSKVYIHRIHYGDRLQPGNQFHGIAATYPQDVRNCDTCHANAAQGGQSITNPSRAACTSCHDYVDFSGNQNLPTCNYNHLVLDDGGLPVPCEHIGGAQSDDTKCTLCHTTTSHSHYAADTAAGLPVEPPDPTNSGLDGGTNAHTNAGWMAQGSFVPPGAAQIQYVIKSVGTWTDGTNKRPTITFKLQMNQGDAGFQDVVFNTPISGQTVEIMPNFVGAPSVYAVWAVPQDGITAPADFNASASVYIKDALNGKAGTGTMTGPDGNGFYTIAFSNAIVPSGSTMLTGGVGYSYGVTSTQPLTETDLAAYPYTAASFQGGLIMNAPNVSLGATGYTARRPIVDNNQCKNCHGVLGVSPNFHAGQRNDGPTCSFCHNPNQTNGGWAGSSKFFIHALHAGRNRTTNFTWHADSATEGLYDIQYPSPLDDCKTCHLPNTYDFTASASLAAVPNMQPTTVATGTFNNSPTTNPTGYFTISPYVDGTGATNYGSGFSFSATTGATTQASGSNLVISPITAACSACHDSPTDVAHMTSNGGHFYDTRSNTISGAGEQCLICHGPGRVAAVGEVHLQ